MRGSDSFSRSNRPWKFKEESFDVPIKFSLHDSLLLERAQKISADILIVDDMGILAKDVDAFNQRLKI